MGAHSLFSAWVAGVQVTVLQDDETNEAFATLSTAGLKEVHAASQLRLLAECIDASAVALELAQGKRT